MSAHEGGGKAWYHEPLMWLVVGVPVLAVAAGFATLLLATWGSDVVVRDDFRREGLAIYADPARDAAALAAGVRASLSFEAGARRLRATLSLERGDLPDRVIVVLSHGGRAELDRMVSLKGANGVYAGALEPLPDGRWHVELTPPARSWRLRGEFAAGQRIVELGPAGGR